MEKYDDAVKNVVKTQEDALFEAAWKMEPEPVEETLPLPP